MLDLNTILNNATAQPAVHHRTSIDPAVWTMDMMLHAVASIGRMIDPRFVIDNENRKFYENMIYWLMADDRFTAYDPITKQVVPGRPDRGLYIVGNTGTGKTTATRILRQLFKSVGGLRLYDAKGIKVGGCFWEESRADTLASNYGKYGPEALDTAKMNTFYVIDDLGCEPAEVVYMGTRVNVCRQVIEHRASKPTVTIITSNLPLGGDELKERYGDRVVSRLQEMCNYMPLVGRDRRAI